MFISVVHDAEFRVDLNVFVVNMDNRLCSQNCRDRVSVDMRTKLVAAASLLKRCLRVLRRRWYLLQC